MGLHRVRAGARRPWTVTALAVGLALAVVVAAAGTRPAQARAQTTGPAPVKLLIDSLAGPDLFRAYCATCHGEDGRGQGPVASSLKTRPSDLTTLASRNGGVFPSARVRSVLSGDGKTASVVAHGSSAMPVWGPIFRALEAGPQADVRVANLVRHLEATQQR